MNKFIALISVVAAAIAVWGYSMWPRHATVFAERFDRTEFVQLPIGTAMRDAREKLGQPLASRAFTLRERWLYCLSDRQPIIGRRGVFVTTSEIAIEECPAIEFDQTGSVVDVTRLPDTLKGSDAATVRSSVGVPVVVRYGGKFTVWYYSKPKRKNDTYEQMTLTFNEHGRVVDKNVSLVAD